MPCSTEFLLYVTVYRLSVLAIGALSIYLGFRLFNSPAELVRSGAGRATAEVEAGDFTVRLIDVWPGVYFALFGTVLIGIMLWQGPPQMTETIKDTQAVKDKPAVTTVSRQMRGSAGVDIDGEWAKLDMAGISLAEAAEPLSTIARVWRGEGRIKEALAMTRLAYLYGPEDDKAEYLALFADLLEENGEVQKAAEAGAKLEELRQQGEGE